MTEIASTSSHPESKSHGTAKAAHKSPAFAITPAKMLTALLYRWKSALLVGIVFACVGGAIAWGNYKPKYTAMASMRLTASKPGILPGANAEDVANREIDFQKIQSQLVRSRDVLNAVLKKDKIRGLTTIRDLQDPRAWLDKELQAGFIGGTDIFRIGLSGEHPEDIALILNEVQDVYLDQFGNFADKQQANRAEAINSAIASSEDSLKGELVKLRSLAEQLKTGDTQALFIRQKMVLEELGAIKKELSTIEREIRGINAHLAVLRSDLKSIEAEKLPLDVLEEFTAAHPLVQKELAEVSRLEKQIKDSGKLLLATSPRLKQYEDELKIAQAQLQKLKIDSQPEVVMIARNSLTRQKTIQIAQSAEKLRVYEEQRGAVALEAAKYSAEAEKYGVGSFDYEMRRAQIDEKQITLKRLRTEKERIDVEAFNTAKSVHAKNQADVPTINQTSLPKSVAIWAIGGLALGLLGVSFLEARLHRLHKSAEIHHELGIQTLGLLPLLEQKAAQTYGGPMGIEQSLSSLIYSEGVSALCTRLLCDDHLTKNAVIMVSSAGENEGKTMLATQLAAGMARSGRKTLLLDCDFRKPQCHEKLGLAAGPGLCELLNGSVELKDALQALPESEAHLIAAGKRDPMLIKALSNGTFAALIARLRQQFDCIIIDSAPTLVVSDGFLIGKVVDGVLLVIRSAFSKGPAVYQAYEQMTALKIPVLGVVVNGIRGGLATPYYYAKESAAIGKTQEQTPA